MIVDTVLNDNFGAEVSVSKRDVIRTSPDGKNIEIADVFITPISGRYEYYENKTTWDKTPATFAVPTREKRGSHNHFVVEDLDGHGLYIVRDAMRREVHRRQCSIWDLGNALGTRVMRALQTFS
jgi:hypothetical protein